MGIRTITIQSLGPMGDGVHHGPSGKVYVERTAPGDQLKARLHPSSRGVIRGEIVEIIKPSNQRQKPPCPHYGDCGNCSLQHLTPSSYRRWKIQTVQDALARQGLRAMRIRPPLFLEGAHRRRVTFTAKKRGRDVHVGYYQRRSQQVSDIQTCLVTDPRLIAFRHLLKPHLTPLLRPGQSVDCFVQSVGDTLDLLITGQIGPRREPDPSLRRSLSELAAQAAIHRVAWRADEDSPIRVLTETAPVTASFGRLKVALPPGAFLQPTEPGEKALVSAILSALPAKGRFADLFSGCGTFSGPLLECGPVDAYESNPLATAALHAAARHHSLRVYRRDLFKNPLRPAALNQYDAVIWDPPRAGCVEQAAMLALSRVPVLVGVSCNPATFARDARILCERGYRLRELQLVDQFWWSHHVEIVGVFSKGGK